MGMEILPTLTMAISLMSVAMPTVRCGFSKEETYVLRKMLLGSEATAITYDPGVRPVADQSDPLVVNVSLAIFAVGGVSDCYV